jgi:hypothetical protein
MAMKAVHGRKEVYHERTVPAYPDPCGIAATVTGKIAGGRG